MAQQLLEDIDHGATDWEPTDPDRFNNDDLLEREASMGRSNFMLQFMLDTSLSDAEKFPLKCSDLIVTSVNPTHAPDSPYGAQIHLMSFVMLPLSGYLEIISTVQCQSGPTGSLTRKQSAQLIHRVEGQMRQRRLISPNTMVSCTCMKCELIGDGYSDKTLLDILKGCKKEPRD